MSTKQKAKKKKDPLFINKMDQETFEAIDRCAKRLGGKRHDEYFREMITDLIRNNAIHYSLLDEIPARPEEVGKTKFDQLYDAAMELAFPDYRPETLSKFVSYASESDLKIWRVVFPSKFELSSILVRAKTYQDAFALGCDYACRVSLRLYRKIPSDLSIRVIFLTERALRRHLEIRHCNKTLKRHELKLEGRTFTFKQVSGARIFALGHKKTDPRRNLARYVEKKDLEKIMYQKGLYRISGVEAEVQIEDLQEIKIEPETAEGEVKHVKRKKKNV